MNRRRRSASECFYRLLFWLVVPTSAATAIVLWLLAYILKGGTQ